MKIINLIILLQIFLYHTFVASIYPLDFDKIVLELENKDKSITQLKADYTQTINFIDLREIVELEATFIYLRPDKLKIEIKKPFNQTIIVKNKDIWIKVHQTNVVYHTNLQKYKNQNYFPLIFSKDKNYNISMLIKKIGFKFISETPQYYVLSTKKQSKKKSTSSPKETRFIMWINKETLFPEKVSMYSEKYLVETEFKNYTTEFAVDEQEFELEKNAETKVIELNIE